MKVLVLGVGNILLSDESIGVRVVDTLQERFQWPDHVTLLDGGTAGMELMEAISQCSHLLIVDAVRGPEAPGTLIEKRDGEVPVFFRNRISPHQLGISDVLAMLQLTGEEPARMTLVGIVPESLDTGLELSKTLSARFEAMVEAALAELHRWNSAPLAMAAPRATKQAH